jgi:phosphatidylglycerol:prolipoprotein diacylglycerol transferase
MPVDGLSLWGGLAGGGLIAAARLGRRGRHLRRCVLDAVVPCAALGISVGRLGEFLDGHGQGLPSALPWATAYANRLAASPDFGVPRHPAQLYDALVALALFGLVQALPRASPTGTRAAAWRPAGTRTAVFLVGYGGARLLLGAVRLDPAFLFGLQLEQLLALGSIGVGLVWWLRPVLRRAARPAALESAAEAAARPARAQPEDSLAA